MRQSKLTTKSDGLVEEAANFTTEILESTGTLPPEEKQIEIGNDFLQIQMKIYNRRQNIKYFYKITRTLYFPKNCKDSIFVKLLIFVYLKWWFKSREVT